MITKTAVHYASSYLYKEAAFPVSWGGIKSGLKTVGNFINKFNPMSGFNPNTIGAVTPAAARNTAQTVAPRMRQVVQGNRRSMALARGQRRMNNVQRAKSIRQANSVPKNGQPQQVTTPAPQQTTTPTPQQATTPTTTPQQVTTPTPEVNATPQPQFTQEQMNAAKNTNLLGGAVIGAGALGGINYVGKRLFAQPQPQYPMMPMMMPMPMPMY